MLNVSRDSIVCLGSLHQKIFPFSPHPQSNCLQQSFTARYHISSVIMEQHFHTYFFNSDTIVVAWNSDTDQQMYSEKSTLHAVIDTPAAPRRRSESLMFSQDDHGLWVQVLPHPECEYEGKGCPEEKLSLCSLL